MDYTPTERSKRRGPWWRRGIVIIALFVAGLGIMIRATSYYRIHLVWWYHASRTGLDRLEALPSRPMPESPLPDEWVRCRVGQMTFNLPPELAVNRKKGLHGPEVVFRNGSRSVTVWPPEDARHFDEVLQIASQLCPQSRRYTIPRLSLACYQASSDDFRWSMTAKEVRWHVFLMTQKAVIRTASDRHIETLFRSNLDAIVCYRDHYATIQWHSTDGQHHGDMTLLDQSKPIDPAWVRTVCRSIQLLRDEEPADVDSGTSQTLRLPSNGILMNYTLPIELKWRGHRDMRHNTTTA